MVRIVSILAEGQKCPCKSGSNQENSQVHLGEVFRSVLLKKCDSAV